MGGGGGYRDQRQQATGGVYCAHVRCAASSKGRGGAGGGLRLKEMAWYSNPKPDPGHAMPSHMGYGLWVYTNTTWALARGSSSC
jgi:hypothetical protein